MKRICALGLSVCQYLPADYKIVTDRQIEIDKDYMSTSNNVQDSLLSIVYKLDDRTKWPTGDLTYYVSDKANPEVKKFILDNLMMDVSSAVRPAIPDIVSDELALALIRQDGESIDDYANRLNTELDKAKWLNDEYKKSLVSAPEVTNPASE